MERIDAKAADEVTEGYVADVGTDHGFVRSVLWTGNRQDVVAMDVRKGPCPGQQCMYGNYLMEDRIDERLSDGLQELEGRWAGYRDH